MSSIKPTVDDKVISEKVIEITTALLLSLTSLTKKEIRENKKYINNLMKNKNVPDKDPLEDKKNNDYKAWRKKVNEILPGIEEDEYNEFETLYANHYYSGPLCLGSELDLLHKRIEKLKIFN